MPILLQKLIHKGQPRLLVGQALSTQQLRLVKTIPGRAWSQTLRGWHLPDTAESLEFITRYFGEPLVQAPGTNGASLHLPGAPAEEPAAPTQPPPIPPTQHATNQQAAASPAPAPAGGTPPLPLLTLQPLFVNRQERISFEPPLPPGLQPIIKSLPGARWSYSHRRWHVPLNQAVYTHLCGQLQGKASLQTYALRQYLQRRQHVQQAAPQPQDATTTAQQTFLLQDISTHNLQQLQAFVQHLQCQAYSLHTLRTYRNEFIQYLRWLGPTAAQEALPDQIVQHLAQGLSSQAITEHTAHSRLNALKYYYEQVLHKDKFFHSIPRPKKPW
ncbi:MAG TPA: site-specific integrase, partial [Phnomibacter sp.]|nr:site-specific integrase [Phnomibacter sp.]